MTRPQSTRARARVVIVGPVIEQIGGEGIGLANAGSVKVGKVNVDEERWLLDLTAPTVVRSPMLEAFSDSRAAARVAGPRAAVEVGVPVPVLSSALCSRFSSGGLDDFADRVLLVQRQEFGGHPEEATG